jgi:hypothetical protein
MHPTVSDVSFPVVAKPPSGKESPPTADHVADFLGIGLGFALITPPLLCYHSTQSMYPSGIVYRPSELRLPRSKVRLVPLKGVPDIFVFGDLAARIVRLTRSIQRDILSAAKVDSIEVYGEEQGFIDLLAEARDVFDEGNRQVRICNDPDLADLIAILDHVASSSFDGHTDLSISAVTTHFSAAIAEAGEVATKIADGDVDLKIRAFGRKPLPNQAA